MRLRALSALLLLSLATCTTDLPGGPGSAAVLQLAPVFPSSFGLFAQALSIQRAAITVRSLPDSSVLVNTTAAFNPASDTLRLAFNVPFQGDSATVTVALAFLDQNGTALFVDTFPSVALAKGTASAPATGQFPVQYVGPGSNAWSVTLTPHTDTIAGNANLQFTIAAMDDVSNPISQVYVHWSSSNPQAKIDANGLLHGPGTSGGTVVHAVIPSTFGAGGFLEDSAQVAFTGQAPPASGTFNGSIVDGSSQLALAGASVQAALVGVGTTFNATTASDGSFSLGPLPAGTYNITISDGGYVGTKYLNAVMPSGAGVIIVLPPVPLTATSPNSGTISGTVYDAQTDTALTGATVLLHQYANAQGTANVGSVVTDSTGAFTFSNLAAGTYTLEVSASGYVDGTRSTVAIGDITNYSQDVILSRGGPQFRAVLTWSANPSDLDLHAVVKDSLGVYDSIYYSNPGDTLTTALDHDETEGYGPETITIYHQYPGVDTFFVVNYSNEGSDPDTTLARSGAVVRVYNNDALLTTMYVPNQPGTLWNLFTWDGTTLTPLNTMAYAGGEAGAPAPSRRPPRAKAPFGARRR
jgi:hypothetical protein